MLGAGNRRHRRPARILLAGHVRPRRRSEQHLPAVPARARAGQLRYRRAWSRRRGRVVGETARHPVRRIRRGRQLLGRDQPAVLRHDVADRQQRRRHGVRRGEIDRPRHDHDLPVGGGRGHPQLAPARDRQADHQSRQGDLLPVPGRRGHPRRDLARVAGTDPQARDQDDRGHDLDDRGLRGGTLPDRQARRRDRARRGRVRRDLAGAQRRVRQAAESRPEQLRSAPEERPAGAAGELQLHLGQHGRGPECRRAVDRSGLQAVAGGRVRHLGVLGRDRQADRGQYLRALAAVGAGHRGEREADQ